MVQRTESEIKAYRDGFDACFGQFCHYLRKFSVLEAVEKMELLKTAVNAVAEREERSDNAEIHS